ncbi:hypothetical protein J7K42_01990 [bacterium]|nr:hypothetical protein [bacterium]
MAKNLEREVLKFFLAERQVKLGSLKREIPNVAKQIGVNPEKLHGLIIGIYQEILDEQK